MNTQDKPLKVLEITDWAVYGLIAHFEGMTYHQVKGSGYFDGSLYLPNVFDRLISHGLIKELNGAYYVA